MTISSSKQSQLWLVLKLDKGLDHLAGSNVEIFRDIPGERMQEKNEIGDMDGS